MDRFELISKKMELELQVANEVFLSDKSKEKLLKKLIELEFQDDSSDSCAKDKKAPREPPFSWGFSLGYSKRFLGRYVPIFKLILLEFLYEKY